MPLRSPEPPKVPHRLFEGHMFCSGFVVVSDVEGNRGLDLGGSATEVPSDSLRGRTHGVSPGASAGAVAAIPGGRSTPPSAKLPEGRSDDSVGGFDGGAAGSGSSGTASGGSGCDPIARTSISSTRAAPSLVTSM